MKKITLLIALIAICTFTFAQRANFMKTKQIDASTIKQTITPADGFSDNFVPLYQKSKEKGSRAVIWADKFNDPLGVNWVADSLQQSQGQWYIGDSLLCRQKGFNMIKYMGWWSSPQNYDSISKESCAFIGLIDFLISGPAEFAPNAWIATKNPIDCSAFPDVQIAFNQHYKAYNSDTCHLEFSYDGSIWQELLPGGKPINNEVIGNSFSSKRCIFNCSSIAGGQSSVYFRFRITSDADPQYGYGYGWEIDDVSLEPRLDYEVELIERYAYFQTGTDVWSYMNEIPLAQLTDNNNMFFFATVKNMGMLSLNNVRLKVEVKDSLGTTFYTQTGAGIILASDLSDTVWVDDPMFDVPQVIEDYIVYFEILMDETDQKPQNNTEELPFSVVDSVSDHLWKWDCTWGVAGISSGQPGDRNGSMYYLTQTDSVSSITASFSNSQLEVGSTIIPQLWVYDNVNSVWPAEPLLQGEDVPLDSTFMGEWKTFSLTTNSAGEEIIQVTPGDVIQVAAVFECHFTIGQTTRFGAEYLKFHFLACEMALWMAQYNDWIWFSNGSAMSHTLNFKRPKTGINELLADKEHINIYPNPTRDYVNITHAGQSKIFVYNLLGEQMMEAQATGSDITSINLSNLTEGAYIVKVISNKGVVSKKVTLIK